MKLALIAVLGLILAGCSGGAPQAVSIATVPAIVQAPSSPGLPSVQNLIDSGSIIPAGIYACPQIQSGARVIGLGGNVPFSTLAKAETWHLGPQPADKQVIFSCPNGLTIDHLVNATIAGVAFDCAFMGDCVHLRSAAFNSFDYTIQNTGHGTALILDTRDALNTMGNRFDVHIFNADRGIYLKGAWPGELASTTWNRFGYVTLYDVQTGIDFGGAADTNTFDQVHISALHDGGRAVVFNSTDPLNRVVADDNVFHQLMVDVEAGYRGPVVEINASQGNVIENLQTGGSITKLLITHGNPSYTLRSATVFSALELSNTDTLKALQLTGGENLPACDETVRGKVWVQRGATDQAWLCAMSAGQMGWRVL
jgi:hypothetical protein